MCNPGGTGSGTKWSLKSEFRLLDNIQVYSRSVDIPQHFCCAVYPVQVADVRLNVVVHVVAQVRAAGKGKVEIADAQTIRQTDGVNRAGCL